MFFTSRNMEQKLIQANQRSLLTDTDQWEPNIVVSYKTCSCRMWVSSRHRCHYFDVLQPSLKSLIQPKVLVTHFLMRWWGFWISVCYFLYLYLGFIFLIQNAKDDVLCEYWLEDEWTYLISGIFRIIATTLNDSVNFLGKPSTTTKNVKFFKNIFVNKLSFFSCEDAALSLFG